MSTTATERDLGQYNNKSVTVVRNLAEPDKDGNTTVEVEGKVQVGNDTGLLIKPKGKVQFDLIPAEEIEDVFLTPDKAKKLTANKLKVVTVGNARHHLLERHGVTLDWANGVTEEAALDYHNSLDHVELDLGHIHVDKEKTSEESVTSE